MYQVYRFTQARPTGVMCYRSAHRPPQRGTEQYLRVLLILVMSFLVVLIGTVAVVDVEHDLAKNDGLWLTCWSRSSRRRGSSAKRSEER